MILVAFVNSLGIHTLLARTISGDGMGKDSFVALPKVFVVQMFLQVGREHHNFGIVQFSKK